MANGGKLITPSLAFDKKESPNKIISENTSIQLRELLRKVVNSDYGTASLADKNGYNVGGKTGTAESYDKKNRINTLFQFFLQINQIILCLYC